MSTGPSLVHRLREALCDLEVDPAAVRADPSGASWLPAELRTWCDEDAACRQELQEFVAAELELARLSGSARADPFFTARVVSALPSRWVGSRLSPHRRAVILAGFYAGAGAAAWGVLAWITPLQTPLQNWTGLAERAGALLQAGAPAPGVAVAAMLAVALLAVLALGAGRTHTPAR